MENDVSSPHKQRFPGLFSRLKQVRVSRTTMVCLFAFALTILMFVSMAFLSPDALQAAEGGAK